MKLSIELTPSETAQAKTIARAYLRAIREGIRDWRGIASRYGDSSLIVHAHAEAFALAVHEGQLAESEIAK